MRPLASVPIPLPAALDLSAAEPLFRSLTAQLADGGIALDGASVERVATPCLQVLAAAATTAQHCQQQFRLANASAALQAAIADLGLDAIIPLEA